MCNDLVMRNKITQAAASIHDALFQPSRLRFSQNYIYSTHVVKPLKCSMCTTQTFLTAGLKDTIAI